jgi:DNA-binding FrmR family transcriptional regulator
MTVNKGCITKERKIELLSRLNRIDGQVKGIKKMLEDGRYCVDILQQLSSTFEALRGVSKVIMRNYLEICATEAMQSKQIKKREQIYNELMDIIYKFAK